jgi:hypothetical protein
VKLEELNAYLKQDNQRRLRITHALGRRIAATASCLAACVCANGCFSDYKCGARDHVTEIHSYVGVFCKKILYVALVNLVKQLQGSI